MSAQPLVDYTDTSGVFYVGSEASTSRNTWPITGLMPTDTVDIGIRFGELASVWKEETSHLSQLSQRVRHPAYQQILRMGRGAVPLIISDLEREPDLWSHALSWLTGENPVPRDFNGTMDEAMQLWIDWGKNQIEFPDAASRFIQNIP